MLILYEVSLLLVQRLKYLIKEGRVKFPDKILVYRGLRLFYELTEVICLSGHLSYLFLDDLLGVFLDAVEKFLHLLVYSLIHEAKLILISHTCDAQFLSSW